MVAPAHKPRDPREAPLWSYAPRTDRWSNLHLLGAQAAPAVGLAAASSRGSRREMTFDTPSSPIETP